MKWITGLSASQAAVIAIAWPAILIVVSGGVYVGLRLYWWWQARKLGPNASSDVIFTITSWPTLAVLLVGPSVAFLLLWTILRSAGRAT